jgi:hypothetical protein
MLARRLEFAVALGTIGNTEPFWDAAPEPQAGERLMDDDITALDDTDFFAERQRVRELIEHQPPQAVSAELARRMQHLNDELDRRAKQAWSAWR